MDHFREEKWILWRPESPGRETKRSFSTSMSPAESASKLRMPGPVSFLRLTGSQFGGRKRSGRKTIESFHTHGTPPLPDQHGDETVVGEDDLSQDGIAS
jgi:hypothetical protein